MENERGKQSNERLAKHQPKKRTKEKRKKHI